MIAASGTNGPLRNNATALMTNCVPGDRLYVIGFHTAGAVIQMDNISNTYAQVYRYRNNSVPTRFCFWNISGTGLVIVWRY